jgi:cob(I)alamin adenosyltransferase
MKKNIGAGDTGKTKILGCDLDKTSPLISLIGNLDELNSYIGFSRSLLNSEKNSNLKDLDKILMRIQSDIFLISSELANAKLKKKITNEDVKWLESIIIKLEKELKPIKNFIYPTGNVSASSLQVARAICRRVEREAFKFSKRKRIIRSELLSYLNRLSDVLFTIARAINRRMKVKEEVWKL